MGEGLLHVLANPTNQAILSLLAVEPAHPRRIGAMLALSETEVARRLKQMEGLGLVMGTWTHIGRNVKLYKLTTRGVRVSMTPQGLRVELAPEQGVAPAPLLLNPFVSDAPTVGDFVGRAAELATMAGPEPVVVVEGMAGIGKTSLLASFAAQQRKEHGTAVFWHSFRGVESLTWLANRLALFLAQRGDRTLLEAVEHSAELADKRELMLRGLDRSGCLIVLDDLHRVQDEDVRAFLSDAVDRVQHVKLVVASRETPRFRPAPGRVRILQLSGLGDADVAQLLASKGVEAPPETRAKLRKALGGHPLALHLLLASVREGKESLDALLARVPDSHLEEWLLREVDATLTDAEREVLVHASVFRTTFDRDDLAAVSPKASDAGLLSLRRRFLVQSRENGSYALHEIVRVFFYGLLRNKRELHESAASHDLAKGTVEGRLEGLHHLLTAGQRSRVLGLLEQNLDLREFDFIDAGYQNLYLEVLELFPREEVPDARRWALIEDEKGDIRFHRGEWQRALAHYDVAWHHFAGAKDEARVADLGWKRGMALLRLGDPAAAKEACEHGLKVAPAGSLARERLEEFQAELVSLGAPAATRGKGDGKQPRGRL